MRVAEHRFFFSESRSKLYADYLQYIQYSCVRTVALATAPGVWSQELPSRRALENEPGPPWLPPHLLQVILNRDTAAHYDPSLLPEPNQYVRLRHCIVY